MFLVQRRHLKCCKLVIKPVSNDTRTITANVVMESVLLTCLAQRPEAYPKLLQTSEMERFAKTVNEF